ncbi:MICOS complex subunit Mic13 [Cinara cedri]|uniref:MICOS complex subunit MIC13 n=1 Tax=Cinara cedri TaxID=506608 RepID=A0A5E4NCE9_9HEMI|nr:MICOS complex subunit Mic13 [Cinara cedri]
MSKLNKFISYTIKGALFGATIFGSSELGLWKDGETSRELAKLIIAILTPIANKAKSEMPEQVKSLPSVENLKSTSTARWNKSVYAAGEFVIDVPHKCACAANKAYQLVEVQLNPKEN